MRSLEILPDRLFSPPLNIRGQKVSRRQGLLIQEESRKAEVPYIQGLHPGSWHNLIHQCQKWAKHLEPLESHDHPSLDFALSQLEIKPSPQKIRIQGRLDLTAPQFCNTLSSYKVKIGRYPPADELALLSSLFDQIPAHSFIRLDANQTLTTQSFLLYWKVLAPHRHLIDYFEEPFAHPEDYRLLEQQNIPYALDESCSAYLNGHTLFRPKALVFKPSLFGDLRSSYRRLSQLDLPIVISSTYEGPIGQLGNHWLAGHFPGVAHGLSL